MRREFFIHGDNVVECERAKELLERALKVRFSLRERCAVQAPVFDGYSEHLKSDISVQVLSGHSRWGFDISAALHALGSTIRENADAVITEKIHGSHEILFAIEYCGALPAGNNAWQRHGRAYSFGQSRIPYFIYNEIGGQELNADRTVKAPRFPNPAVPLSLVMFSKELKVAVLPVYEAAPSATAEQVREFKEALGDEDVLEYIRHLVSSKDTSAPLRNLEIKATNLGLILAKTKKRQEGYGAQTWSQRVMSDSGTVFYLENKEIWKIKAGDKVEISARAKSVFEWLNSKNLAALGSTALRFATLSSPQREEFAVFLKGQYPESEKEFDTWLSGNGKPLVVALVTGFKPRGDDSRPDRGLVPLARMLAGQEADLLTFVSGPAKANMYQGIRRSADRAAASNGLLQAIFACSDWALLDTKNESTATIVDTRGFRSIRNSSTRTLPGELALPSLGEHDIDAMFHFACTQPARESVFEGMCNPPGGDWSGINLRLQDESIARWTSLPRVSGTKRPDHVVQTTLDGKPVVLTVESKQNFSDLEPNIGPNLKAFVQELFDTETEVRKKSPKEDWTSIKPAVKAPKYPLLSLAIAADGNRVDLEAIIRDYDLDFAFAFSLEHENRAKVRVAAASRSKHLLAELTQKLLNDSDLDFEVCE